MDAYIIYSAATDLDEIDDGYRIEDIFLDVADAESRLDDLSFQERGEWEESWRKAIENAKVQYKRWENQSPGNRGFMPHIPTRPQWRESFGRNIYSIEKINIKDKTQ